MGLEQGGGFLKTGRHDELWRQGSSQSPGSEICPIRANKRRKMLVAQRTEETGVRMLEVTKGGVACIAGSGKPAISFGSSNALSDGSQLNVQRPLGHVELPFTSVSLNTNIPKYEWKMKNI